ncbi:Ser/Thr protein kinase RdoA involved in Cpx stress response, MazF antagonist [Paenibacillus polysaccharolyticus]|uniref:Ser/Thr protein kinase RdoA involved in Cpx stress response, MazF antagonist n=1 Tax=Paenibacillus polysaccharolyticus TaxID=582692 RepID=A0A1G5IVT6_9BACL|nr:phosphotransferase [Paenibacillus polysaccharolyticus]SCY79830.1 Ser/Thr protein kinase RdoA involved in Cpx stress response, MazF antagonist [Paenibacillus polysaccharolyticus]
MEKRLKELFTKEVLHEAAQRFNIIQSSLKDLQGFQNFVYFGKSNDESIVLRITHKSHRTEKEIVSEIDFINHLSSHHVSVSKAKTSIHGKFVEAISDGEFYATSFEFSSGRKAKIAEESDLFYQRIGGHAGRVHSFSKTSNLIHHLNRRQWHEKEFLIHMKEYLPAELSYVMDKYEILKRKLSQLPKNTDSYGMIHGDLNHGNYLNVEDDVVFIDFDEAEYSWFVSDIAIPLFYEIPIPWVVDGKQRLEITKRYYYNFMDGYVKENTIDNAWLKLIPDFINLRQSGVVSAIYRSYNFDNYNNWSDWDKEALKFYLNNIEHDIPYIDMDFSR